MAFVRHQRGECGLANLRGECGPAGGLHLSQPAVFGVLSLVFWSLIVIVPLTYVVLTLRADNRGEGGILALTALATPIRRLAPSQRRWIVLLGVFGAALLYGDKAVQQVVD